MFGSNKIIAIDIGAGNICLGVFAPMKSGGIQLVDFAIESLGVEGGDDESRSCLITALHGLIHDHDIKPGPVLLTIPGQQVFSRFVRLPPVSEDKIDQIVRYEAQQNVPFPINEVVWDYQLIGGSEGEVDVMLAAVKLDLVETLCQAVEQLGFEPELVDVAPLALYNTVRYNYDELPACTLVVDMGARSTDLIFIEEGRVFSRSIPAGGNAITNQIMKEFDQSFEDAEEIKKTHGFVAFGGAYEAPSSEVADKVSKSVRSVMTRLHAEIGRSVNFYRTQQQGTKPGLILLTGGSSVLPYTDRFLEEKLSVKVDFLNPFQNVTVGQNIDDKEIASSANRLGEVVGSSLRKMMSCPIEIDLLPPSVRAQKAMRKKLPFFIVTAFCLVLVAGVWCAYFLKLEKLAGKRLAKIEARVCDLQVEAVEMSKVESEMALIEKKKMELINLSTSRSQRFKRVQAIHRQLPAGMWIIGLSGRDEGGSGGDKQGKDGTVRILELEGRAYVDKHPNGQSVTRFAEKLGALKEFEKSKISWMPAPGDDPVMKFKIELILNKSVQL